MHFQITILLFKIQVSQSNGQIFLQFNNQEHTLPYREKQALCQRENWDADKINELQTHSQYNWTTEWNLGPFWE